jgi:hypothetical protein
MKFAIEPAQKHGQPLAKFTWAGLKAMLASTYQPPPQTFPT